MSNNDAENENTSRYYPKQQEMQILIPNLRRYFSYPERSQQRSQLVKDVKSYLEKINPHWNHRAVRLWFNNNKNNYLTSPQNLYPNEKQICKEMQHQEMIGMMIRQQGQGDQMQQNFLQLQKQNVGALMQQPQRIGGLIQQPQQMPENPQMMQPYQGMHVLNYPFSPSNDKNRYNTTQRPPISFSSKKVKKPLEQSLASISSLMSEIRKEDPKNPNYRKQVNELDKQCFEVREQYSFLPDRIEPTAQYLSFSTSSSSLYSELGPSITNLSTDFMEGSKFSFSQFSLSDLCNPSHDQIVQKSIWKSPIYVDQKIENFIDATISKDLAAYASSNSQQTKIFYSAYKSNDFEWKSFDFFAHPSKIEKLRISNNTVWVLSSSGDQRNLTSISLSNNSKQTVTMLCTSQGSSSLSLFNDGVIVGFSDNSKIFFVNQITQVQIQTEYYGITCLSIVGNKIVCGVSKSCSPRLIEVDGKEERAFIGHCDQVTDIIRLTDTSFASLGKDQSIRIWDINDSSPLTTIIMSDMISIISLSSSSKYLFCGCGNQKIGVIDFQKSPGGKVVLGISTDDFEPTIHYYDEQIDNLYIFGKVHSSNNECDNNNFVPSENYQQNVRIFRTYQKIFQ